MNSVFILPDKSDPVAKRINEDDKHNTLVFKSLNIKPNLFLFISFKIFKWISIFGKKYKNISDDEYLTRVSEKKMDVFAVFKKIIIDSSIENSNKNMKGGMYYNRYIRYKNRYIKLKT